MTLVSGRELEVLRNTQESTFDLTATIKRMVLVSDGAGGQVETPSTVASAVPCSVEVNKTLGGEIVVAGKLTSQQTWLVKVPWGTAVKDTDWVEVSNGFAYDAISVRAPISRETAVVILATRRG